MCLCVCVCVCFLWDGFNSLSLSLSVSLTVFFLLHRYINPCKYLIPSLLYAHIYVRIYSSLSICTQEGSVIRVQEEPYTVREARIHVRHVRDLLKSLDPVDAFNGIDCASLSFLHTVTHGDILGESCTYMCVRVCMYVCVCVYVCLYVCVCVRERDRERERERMQV